MIQHRSRNCNRLVKRYPVPNTPPGKPRWAAFGYFDTSILRSVRTGRGRIYGDDTINFLISILDEAQADGMTQVEVVINYQRLGVSVTYATSIETLRSQGQRVLGESGWELALLRQLWSVDGAEPEGLPAPKPEPKPEAVQVALFDYAEPQRKVVAY